jgi:hypothetical protein
MGVTSEAGTAYPSGAPEFPADFIWGSCYSIFSCIWTTMLEIKWHSCIVRGFLLILNYCIGNYLLCLSSVNIHTLCYDILIHIWTWEYIRVRKVVLTLQTSNYIRHHFSYLLMGFSVNDYFYSTLSWFRSNQSLIFFIDAACLSEKQHMPIA